MALEPHDEARIATLENRLRDIEDIFNSIRFPSFWRFTQPLVSDILRLPNLSADPATATAGELAVVGGKLKIYDGAAWTIVGTQT